MSYDPISSIASVAINAGGQSWTLNATDGNDRMLRVNNAAALRGFDGNPSTGIGSFAYSIGARTVDLEVTAIGDGGVTAFHDMCEAMIAHPGTATIEVGIAMDSVSQNDGGGGLLFDTTFWSQHVGLAKVELEKTTTVANTYKLSITLLDGAWTGNISNTTTFRAESAGSTSDSLDLPFDTPFDLGVPGNATRLNGLNAGRQLWPVITIVGPCATPSVTIGNNRYAVTAPIPAGNTLTIDTVAKTVKLTHGGVSESWLGKAVIGMGEGSGSYIFEPLPERQTWAADGIPVTTPSDATTTISIKERILALNM